MYTAAQISAMTEEEKADFEKMVARRLALRVAGFVFIKIATVRILGVLANRSYQSSVTEH